MSNEETKFTPGPWVLFECEGCEPYIQGSDGRFMCTLDRLVPGAREQQKFDARLITAAPDLYIAARRLRDAVASLHEFGDIGEIIGQSAFTALFDCVNKVDYTLAKARGE